MTALHIAAQHGQLLALYKIITAQSSEVNIRDIWGKTPLDHAVSGKHWSCAVLLISFGGCAFLSSLRTSACCGRAAPRRHLRRTVLRDFETVRCGRRGGNVGRKSGGPDAGHRAADDAIAAFGPPQHLHRSLER